MTDTTRNLIDYAMDGDGVKFRETLYADIHDRVTNHLQAAKQAVAQNIMASEDNEDVEDGESAAEDSETTE
jgi:hypothetical protein